MTPQLPSDVIRVATDSSGRGLYMTRYMASWWKAVCAELGFTPTITQGAWMVKNGGGAAASAGYHDGGGCLDLRVWDLTDEQVGRLVRTLRRHGAAAWLRNLAHGGFTDPHIHLVLGSDFGLSYGARSQWSAYLNGRSGLASNGPDYHWRPSPLVLTPPKPAPKPAPAPVINPVEVKLRRRLTRGIKDAQTLRKWGIAKHLKDALRLLDKGQSK